MASVQESLLSHIKKNEELTWCPSNLDNARLAHYFLPNVKIVKEKLKTQPQSNRLHILLVIRYVM